MNVKTNDEEKLVYLHMWGSIVPGDDIKFKSLILPYLRNGYVLFEVRTFTTGGDIQAAMQIGNLVRALQARTVAPTHFTNEPGYAQCWFVASTNRGGVGYHPNTIHKRDLRTGSGSPWCDCASACFLIWASGVTREGNFVGVHRLRFDESYFGSLSAAEARNAYAAAEADFRAYLASLNVPASIVDKLFATDSRSMYYLSESELEVIKSTPYLEELTQAKCPPDRTRHEYYADGTWKSTTEDPVRINCYREILKELMREGVRNYLATLGETPIQSQSEPSGPTPNIPSAQIPRYWNHNGSSLRLDVEKAKRRFVFIEPRPGLKEVGVSAGMVAFDGRRIGKRYKGTAYVFSQKCGAIGYPVTGAIAKDERRVTLRGSEPYVNSECRTVGVHRSILVFELVGN